MLSNTINNLVQDLRPRQREIINGRFGLESGEKNTLASIGEKYGITRERVRQIESEALRIIQERLNKEKAIKEILEATTKHLNTLGGLRKDDILLQELKTLFEDDNLHHWHLRFLSEAAYKPLYYPPDEEFHKFWYLDRKNTKRAIQFIDKLEKLIADKKEDLVIHQKFDFYFQKATKFYNLPDLIGANYILVSRKFDTNPFGDLGLSSWEEINPKTARSKIYLILKKENHPLHFREITEKINSAGFNGRRAYPQTIHNELIKDPRFVLVGRGIYALKEQGYLSGTAQEVISEILKEEGPLSLNELIDSVLKQRFLKNNTILINLQNKKYFKRLPDGRYTIVK